MTIIDHYSEIQICQLIKYIWIVLVMLFAMQINVHNSYHTEDNIKYQNIILKNISVAIYLFYLLPRRQI